MAVSTETIQAGLKPLLTKPETAELYAVETRTIDRWLFEGILPASAKVIIGGSVRFRSAVLLADIENRATDQHDDAGAGDDQ